MRYIVVVDDRPLVATGVMVTLEDAGFARELGHDVEVVTVDVATADTMIGRERPDVVVIAVSSVADDDPTFVLLEKVTSTRIAPTIAIVRHVAPATCSILLAAGCAGIVSEISPAREIARAVGVVANGGEHVDQIVMSKLLEHSTIGVDGPATRGSRLSVRELAVLELVAEGCSGNEIASRLDVAPSTVKTHLKHVFTKLEVRDRAHAVARGFRTGLLS